MATESKDLDLLQALRDVTDALDGGTDDRRAVVAIGRADEEMKCI